MAEADRRRARAARPGDDPARGRHPARGHALPARRPTSARAVHARGAALPQGRPDRDLPAGVRAAARRARLRRRAGSTCAAPARPTGWPTDEYPAQEQRDLCRGHRLARRRSRGAPARSACTARRTPASTRCRSRASDRRRSRRSCAIYATDDRYTDDVHYMGGVAAAARPRRLPDLHGRDERAAAGARAGRRRVGRRRGATRVDDLRAVAAALARGAARLALLAARLGAARLRPHRAARRCSSAAGPTAIATTPSAPSRRCAAAASRTGCCSDRGATCRRTNSLPGPHIDLVPVMARWWDRWLRGIDERRRRRAGADLVPQHSTRPGAGPRAGRRRVAVGAGVAAAGRGDRRAAAGRRRR